MPVSRLEFKARYSRLLNWPNSVGMVPVSRLFSTSSEMREDRYPNSGGSVPTRLLSAET